MWHDKQGWYDPTDEECKKRTKNDKGIDGQIVDEYRGLYDIFMYRGCVNE